MEEKSKYCCEEHMDRAFDDFLVEEESFPNLEEVQDKACSYCSKSAKYVLKLPENINK